MQNIKKIIQYKYNNLETSFNLLWSSWVENSHLKIHSIKSKLKFLNKIVLKHNELIEILTNT